MYPANLPCNFAEEKLISATPMLILVKYHGCGIIAGAISGFFRNGKKKTTTEA
jgi:hypothetical protein